MKQMIVILSIERRKDLALKTFESLLDCGVPKEKIKIIYGYDKLNYPEIKPFHLVPKALFELIIPQTIGDIFYVECGTKFKENPLNIEIDKQKINWLGYVRILKNYIVGAKCIYLPRIILEDLKNIKKYTHIDKMIMNYGIKNNNLLVSENSIVNFYKYESDFNTKKNKKNIV